MLTICCEVPRKLLSCRLLQYIRRACHEDKPVQARGFSSRGSQFMGKAFGPPPYPYQPQILMNCVAAIWDKGKEVCGPKRFYALVTGSCVFLLTGVALGIWGSLRFGSKLAVPKVSVVAPPVQGNVQVQGQSTSLVHIQEGIHANNNSGPTPRGAFHQLGLLAVVSICFVLFVVLLLYQLLRLMRPRSRSAPEEVVVRQEQLERLQHPDSPPEVRGLDKKVARMVQRLEREEYDDRVDAEIAMRARQALVDQQTSTSLTVTSHPSHRGVKVLPVIYAGESGRPAAMMNPSVISQLPQLLPPQDRGLEDSRFSAPARGVLPEESEGLDEAAGLRDLRDSQSRKARQDMVASLAAPPFVAAGAQGLLHHPF